MGYKYAVLRRRTLFALCFLAGCGDPEGTATELNGTQGSLDATPSSPAADATSADAIAHTDDASADAQSPAAETSVLPQDGGAIDASDAAFDRAIDATDAKADVLFSFDAPAPSDAARDACAETAVEAKTTGIDLYVMLDRSGSMHGPVSTWQQAKGDCDVGQTVNSKWCKSINALAKYFGAPTSSGNRAALQFFSGTLPVLYSTPEVPLGTGFISLPDTTSFVPALNAATPSGETPTEAALRGIVTYTGNSSTYTPGRQRIGILVTDGYPQGNCESSASKLAAIADAHYQSTGVPIFMVGMDGADFTHLETMATGGHAPKHANNAGGLTKACGNGSSQCQSWNVGDGSNDALTVALQQIQYQAAACSFAVPTSDAGLIDPNSAKVEYLQGGSNAQSLQRATSQSACGTSGGFYYDNNTSPTVIYLCPTTCDTVRADTSAKVQVKLGCQGS